MIPRIVIGLVIFAAVAPVYGPRCWQPATIRMRGTRGGALLLGPTAAMN